MNNPAIDINAATRGLALRMGNTLFEQGELWQAMDRYLRIIEDYPNSEESQTAQTQLMNISQSYEQEGLLRLSLTVLERLEQTMATTE